MCLALPDSFVVVLSVTSILLALSYQSQRMTIGKYSSVSALRERCLKSGGIVSYVASLGILAAPWVACEIFHIGNMPSFLRIYFVITFTRTACDIFHIGNEIGNSGRAHARRAGG